MTKRSSLKTSAKCKAGTALLVLGLMLAGCETGTGLDDADTLIGGESAAEKAVREAREAAIENKVPVASVRGVEIGRTRDGYLISAFGTAPGLGYSLPALRPRRGGALGGDGYIEFDFVATVPAEGFDLPEGNTRTRAMRADTLVRERAFQNARGVRVLASSGGVQVPFARPAPTETTADPAPE